MNDPDSKAPSGPGNFVLIYQSSPVQALFEGARSVGGCQVAQVVGPIKLQWTETSMLPGRTPRLAKRQLRREVGDGLCLTVVTLSVEVALGADLRILMDEWSQQCRAALAMTAALLDDRVCEKYLGENMRFESASGLSAIVDYSRLVRSFDPAVESEFSVAEALDGLDNWEYHNSDALNRSLRWYLAAVELGPSSAGFVLLATACEALISPTKGKNKSFNKQMIEAQLTSAGMSFDSSQVAKVVRVRAAIVHDGFEEHVFLSESYYLLEEMTRSLLRAARGSGTGWPVKVSSNLEGGEYSFVQDFQW